jgi:hypothetical protein
LTRATGGRGLIYTNTATEGTISINGVVLNHLKASVNGHGPIQLDMAGSGVSVDISYITGTVAADADAASTFLMYGIKVNNADDAVVRNCNITMSDPSAQDVSVYGITMYGSDGALSSARQVIKKCTVTMDTDGGFGISFGGDLGDVVANEADGSTMTDVKVIGSARFIAGNGHAIGLGEHDNCVIQGGEVSYADIGVLDKLGDNNEISGVLIHHCGGGPSNVACFSKGATNGSFHDNKIVIQDGYEPNAYEAAADSATNAADNQFNNNVVAVLSDTENKVINVAASQTATFTKNQYYIGGAIPSNPFTYQSTNYANVKEWIAARDPGAKTFAEDPFVGSNVGNYRLANRAGASPRRNNGKRLILRNYMPIDGQGYHSESEEKIKRLKIAKPNPKVRIKQ